MDLLNDPLFSKTKKKYGVSTTSNSNHINNSNCSNKEELNKNYDNIIYGITECNSMFKNQNEDYIFYEYEKSNVLMCVFDGHGGLEASSYLSKEVKDVLNNNLKNNEIDSSDYEKYKSQTLKSLHKTFLDLDKALKFQCGDNIGSTATIFYIRKNNSIQNSKINFHLFSANVGDSKGFIANLKTREIVELTESHTLNNINERERVKNNIIKDRLNGVLCLTRSIGDHFLIDKGLICDPYQCSYNLEMNQEYLIFLGSDGVWDVLNEQNVLDLYFENSKIPEFVNKVIETSKNKLSKDNICFIAMKI